MNQTAVNYKTVLSDLRLRRARLDTAISAIEAILGELHDLPQNGGSKGQEGLFQGIPQPTGTYADMTIAASAIHYLGSVGKPQGTLDIVRALERGGTKSASKNLYRTLYNTLNNRLDKDITRTGKKWGLKQWQ